MRPSLAAFLITLALPALAEGGPNIAPAPDQPAPDQPGAVRALSLARQLYALGLAREDPVILLTAIKLAHSADLRAATGWQKSGDGTAPLDAAAPTGLPRDPASPAALALAMIMAEGDPALADLAADIEAGLARGPAALGHVSMAGSALPASATDSWRIPFFGQSRAELAVLGDGSGNLDLRVTDETGAVACLETGPEDQAYCAFTPAWNGYFTITVTNRTAANTYALMTN